MTPPSSPSTPCRARLLLAAGVALIWLAGCATNGTQSSAEQAAAEPPLAVASAPDATMTQVPPVAPAAAASAPEAAPDEGPAVAAPIDPLRPEVKVDLDDRSAQTDLWGRVRQGFGMPELDSDYVRKGEQWYASRPDYVQRMTERGSRYLYHIVEEVEKRGMPTELALLPFIESAFNPQAMSVAKASGMWQFVPATGRDYDLKQNLFRDDRRDVLASTRAALDYLGRLYKQFGDWQLALAAYNWGEGNVQRAIARNERQGLPTNYESLRMPEETRYYVPKLQAVKNIVLRPEAFQLSLPPLENHPYFLSVPIERDIDVDLAARFAGLTVDEFKQLNPQMNKPIIIAAGTPQVLLPYDNANTFVRNIQQHRGPLASWTAWVANKTLRPSDAAKQLGISEDRLREVNHIPPRMLVKAGSTLLVPRSEHRQEDVSEKIADTATIALAPDLPPMRRVSLKAGKRDSVASVARRYKVSPALVAQWNKVGVNASFKPGQAIAVFLPASSRATVQTAARAKPAARVAAARPASGKVTTRAVANRSAKARVRVAAR
jgi:membrane-bound lytic murein transglycosylase D